MSDERDKFYSIAIILILLIICLTIISLQHSYKTVTRDVTGWDAVKQVLYNDIYKGHEKTFYYGCSYKGKTVDLSTCEYKSVRPRAKRVEAEHIVPASLFSLECLNIGRSYCEENDPKGQAVLFDLHNLVPSVGQVNLVRGNRRYGETPGTFNPPDCVKGDVARIWLYARDRHGIVLLPGEKEMFERWSRMDPVSSWEAERQRRISKHTFVENPYVKGQTPDLSGACPWE